MCVSEKLGVVVCSRSMPQVELLQAMLGVSADPTKATHAVIHSLCDGKLLRNLTIVGGEYSMHLCTSADDERILMACSGFNRGAAALFDVRIADGHVVRVIESDIIHRPGYVTCDARTIALCCRSPSYIAYIAVLSWADGLPIACIGGSGSGPGELYFPQHVRLLAGGLTLAVADWGHNRLSVFTLDGKLVTSHRVTKPLDMVEVHDGFIVSQDDAYGYLSIVHVSTKTTRVMTSLSSQFGLGKVAHTLAALSGGGIVAQVHGRYCALFFGLELRAAWLALVCVSQGAAAV